MTAFGSMTNNRFIKVTHVAFPCLHIKFEYKVVIMKRIQFRYQINLEYSKTKNTTTKVMVAVEPEVGIYSQNVVKEKGFVEASLLFFAFIYYFSV
jgi:hypothetical protein